MAAAQEFDRDFSLHKNCMVELVVFDLAGTTVKDNNDVQRALQKALAYFDVYASPDQVNAVMGIPKPLAIRTLMQDNTDLDKISEDLIREVHQVFVRQMIHFYERDPSVSEKVGVTTTFRKLKERKLKIAIDTGFDRRITNSILQRLGWIDSNLIDASVASDEVPRGRPFPDMIFRAMELTHVKDSKRVAKVGDTASDLEQGTAAGCGWVIGVTTGAFAKDKLQKQKHTHLIENVQEVLDIFFS